MSDQLQFEKAEYSDAAAAAACVGCQGALTDSYYAVGDRILCRECAEKLQEELTNQGSRSGRVFRALGAGAGAAVLGTLLYYGVLALTGYEFGLIAIVVGYGVGAAVRWGSRGRGGWAYQGLAIALTYLSIVTAYIPPILQGFREASLEATAAERPQSTDGSAAGSARVTPVAESGSAKSDLSSTPPTLGQVIFSIVLLLVIACAAPFLAGIQNIIGLVIIGIGLYEAWKLNKRVSIEITGPHPVAMAPAPGA